MARFSLHSIVYDNGMKVIRALLLLNECAIQLGSELLQLILQVGHFFLCTLFLLFEKVKYFISNLFRRLIFNVQFDILEL